MLRDISLHIIDLTQNSVKAGASFVKIDFTADVDYGTLSISIEDNGCGMNKEFLDKVTDPYTTGRTTRKVGMGIPFFKLACEETGGNIEIQSEVNKGTKISGYFNISHVDRLPLGDLGESVSTLILGSPEIDFLITMTTKEKNKDDNVFVFDTKEIKEQIGEVSIAEYEVLNWIKEYVNEGTENIFGGVLDEVNRRTESD